MYLPSGFKCRCYLKIVCGRTEFRFRGAEGGSERDLNMKWATGA